ncbi:MAG TPA: hypothetical protein VMZ53_14340 [Kofleriaceae bacterium]|nr:hypothetical protein [Kofleriaceae bacterium]
MTRILLVLALAACGGGTQAGPVTAHPEPPPPTRIESTPPVTKALVAEECQQLAKHVVQLSVKERPEDQQPSAEDLDKLDLRSTVELCLTLPRGTYDCAMAASTTTAMAACDQRTPSSSTSNTSVAPGGITPPAPR